MELAKYLPSKPLMVACVILLLLTWLGLFGYYIYQKNVAVTSAPQVLAAQETVLLRGDAEKVNFHLPLPRSETTPKLGAESYLAVDLNTGMTLTEKNTDTKLQVASLTKMMTVYVGLQHLGGNDDLVMAGNTSYTNPIVGFRTGQKVKLSDLVESIMVCSANDAAIELARAVSIKTGKPFSDLMNESAYDLGMTDSHFDNPNGFDSPQNYTTAKDLKVLASRLYAEGLVSLYGRQNTAVFGTKALSCEATNGLLAIDTDIMALKTGSTELAKQAMITVIENKGHPILLMVLKSPDRDQDMKKLKEHILTNWEWK
ncbi:MAG TPA: serine hydrolase [Patescibacteria group bacterium]|nr:serine hydrolase [Patescibacteria group bacterium]